MAFNGHWVCEVGTPINAIFVSDAEYQAALDGGYVDAFEYATAPIADADLILTLVPADVLLHWAAAAGVTRTREMTQTQLIWAYLWALGYAAVDGVLIINVHDFSGDTAGGETVTIDGHGFLNGHPGATTVTADDTPFSSVTVVDDDTITAVSPAHAADTMDLIVTNGNGTFTAADALVYA